MKSTPSSALFSSPAKQCLPFIKHGNADRCAIRWPSNLHELFRFESQRREREGERRTRAVDNESAQAVKERSGNEKRREERRRERGADREGTF